MSSTGNGDTSNPIYLPEEPTEIKVRQVNKRKRSDVWDHFIEIESKEGGGARCKYCNATYQWKGGNGTSTLRKHTIKCWKNPNQDNKQTLLSFQSITEEVGDSTSLSVWKFDHDLCREALGKMIIMDELPFNFVERDGFRYFLSVLQPRFKIMSRTTIARDCLMLYASEKNKLKESFLKSNQRLSLTTDCWTSLQNLSYMCLTAHFIDSDWKLHKRILNFCVISSHKGEAIGKAVERCLNDWGIDKLCTLTVDNASSNDLAIQYLRTKTIQKSDTFILRGEFFHMRCCAHILNLIVRDGLSELKDSITRIRGAVRYVRSSPQREQIFKQCAEMAKITSKSSLCLDVQTRWNSTYLMLKAALKFERAFKKMEDEDPHFVIELKYEPPTNSDWNDARVFTNFLEKFYDATTRMSGSLYVTSNVYFHEVCSIERNLSLWSKSLDPRLSAMAIKMKSKFDKYWGNIEKVNMMLVLAVVLDPRYKLNYVSFCYSKVYPPTMVSDLIKKVREILDRIYDEYQKFESDTSSSTQTCNVMEVDQPSSESVDLKDIQLEYLQHLEQVGTGGNKSEVERYLEEACAKHENFDILSWWKVNSSRYEVLSKIVRDILAIPVSTVASESAFSTGGRVLDPFRSSLTPKIVECLICAQDWYRASPLPIQVEAKADEIEAIESAMSCLTTA